MFSLELVRPWTLDVRKMLRPERSGVIANLVVYMLLGGGAALTAGAAGGCGVGQASNGQAAYPSTEWIRRHYDVHLLYRGMGALDKPSLCTCHGDVRLFKDNVIHHYHNDFEEECGDWFTQFWPVNTWFEPATSPFHSAALGILPDGHTEVIVVHQGEGEVQLHCENNKGGT